MKLSGWSAQLLATLLVGGAVAPGVITFVVTLLVLVGRAGLEGRPVVLNDVLAALATGGLVGVIGALIPLVMRRAMKNGAFAEGTLSTYAGHEPGAPSLEHSYDRFDRFDDAARKVLTVAQDEAQRFNHNYIGTEHLLLALVRVESVASEVLRARGVDTAKVRTAVEFIIGRGDTNVSGEVGLTPRSKRVIELSIDEARRLDAGYIGAEHILLGLLREGEGIAAGVLESFGIDLEKLRDDVLRLGSRQEGSDPA
jgi:hypothetical protein